MLGILLQCPNLETLVVIGPVTLDVLAEYLEQTLLREPALGEHMLQGTGTTDSFFSDREIVCESRRFPNLGRLVSEQIRVADCTSD